MSVKELPSLSQRYFPIRIDFSLLLPAGYMFNIGMLKTIFAPEFQLHDIKQTGEYEATTRWTMIMKPTFNRKLGLQRFWDPRLIFTGVSIMGVNPENGEHFSLNPDKGKIGQHLEAAHNPSALLLVTAMFLCYHTCCL